MWKCHKCGKPVYFAERKQSLGYDWHPECLRCEECGKRLNPGQHAEHKGVPYCHVPCYGALFGPQLFGHGTRVESHKSFGQKGPIRSNTTMPLPRSHLESKLKVFNQFYESQGKSGEVRSREVNGRLVLEGSLRVHWGVRAVIHLKEDVDQRTLVTRGRPPESGDEIATSSPDTGVDTEGDISVSSNSELESVIVMAPETTEPVQIATVLPNTTDNNCAVSPAHKCLTLPPKLDVRQIEWDELDDLLQVERKVEDSDKLYQTMPSPLPSQSSLTQSESDSSPSLSNQSSVDSVETEEVVETTCDSNSSTLKPNQFEDFDDRTLRPGIAGIHPRPIDATKINDSLKLYSDIVLRNGDNMTIYQLSKSNDGQLNASKITDTLNLRSDVESSGTLKRVKKYEEYISRPIPLQKSQSGHCSRSISQDDSWIEHAERDMSKLVDGNKTDVEGKAFLDDSGHGNSEDSSIDDHVYNIKPVKTGSTAIRRRPGKRRSRTKLQRRCSINGHFYNRETSFFTPPHGSTMNVWVSSLLDTRAVISLILDKYKVDSQPENFALFVVRDNGEQRRLSGSESPLVRRVLLGPHEDVARIFLMDCSARDVSSSVAQFLNLSVTECRAILQQYHAEEQREINRVQEKYKEMHRRILQRMESLKVRL